MAAERLAKYAFIESCFSSDSKEKGEWLEVLSVPFKLCPLEIVHVFSGH